jgi:hypothetical protein
MSALFILFEIIGLESMVVSVSGNLRFTCLAERRADGVIGGDHGFDSAWLIAICQCVARRYTCRNQC